MLESYTLWNIPRTWFLLKTGKLRDSIDIYENKGAVCLLESWPETGSSGKKIVSPHILSHHLCVWFAESGIAENPSPHWADKGFRLPLSSHGKTSCKFSWLSFYSFPSKKLSDEPSDVLWNLLLVSFFPLKDTH